MADTRIPRATLYGGVSTQPDAAMRPNQVKSALNVAFSVRTGAEKRPGSRRQFGVADLLAGGNYRVYPIERDESEKYLVVYGRGATDMELRVFDLDGNEADVTISATAQAYLNAESSTADDLRFATNADTTLVVNRGVATGVETAPVYSVAANLTNWDAGTAYDVAADVYFHADEDCDGHRSGYYRFKEDVTGFAKWRGPSVADDWSRADGKWNDDLNPVGFKVTFRDRDGNDTTYEVKENFGNPADLDSNGIGVPATDMEEIALRLQSALRDAGATTAGIRYSSRSDGSTRFHILAPYRGTGASVVSITAPSTGVYDLSASGLPFCFAQGTATAGSGDPDEQTLPLEDRIERVASPGDTKARLTASTMPMKLTRTSISPLEFDLDVAEWDDRTSGNESSNPPASIFEDGRAIADIAFHRNRLVLAGDECVVLSQAAEFYNFWIDEYDNIADADPIDATLSIGQVCLVDSLTPFRKSLVIATKSGRQFELNTPEILTPNTAAITPSTTYRTVEGVQPVTMGPTLYLPAVSGAYTQVLEYYYDDSLASARAADISAHVEGWIPDSPRRLCACLNNDIVLCLPEDSSSVYLHRSFWSGQERAQSAWGEYAFGTSTIKDVAVFGSTMWVLLEDALGYSFHSASLVSEDADTGYPYRVCLDRRVSLTGVYAGGVTTWTLAEADDLLDTAVVGYGSDAGDTVSIATDDDGATYYATGDYSGGECTLGLSYDMSLTLPRPYPQDANGAPILDQNLTIHKVTLNHYASGDYELLLVHPPRSARVSAFSPTASFLETQGKAGLWVNGLADNVTITVRSNNPLPLTLNNAEFTASLTRRAF